MKPEGYILMQHTERLSRPAKAYKRWADRTPSTYRESVLGLPPHGPRPSGDSDCLAQLKHYRSLMPMAQEVRKPIFQLAAADGAIGSHSDAVKEASTDFRSLAIAILSRTNQLDGKL
jgi:chromosome partitioning protein